MKHRSSAIGGLFWALAALIGCQPTGSNVTPTSTDIEGSAAATTEIAAGSEGPDWQQAEDCRDKLVLLQQGLSDGRIVELDDTPFTLIEQDATSTYAGWSSSALPSSHSETASDARCVIRVGKQHLTRAA